MLPKKATSTSTRALRKPRKPLTPAPLPPVLQQKIRIRLRTPAPVDIGSSIVVQSSEPSASPESVVETTVETANPSTRAPLPFSPRPASIPSSLSPFPTPKKPHNLEFRLKIFFEGIELSSKGYLVDLNKPNHLDYEQIKQKSYEIVQQHVQQKDIQGAVRGGKRVKCEHGGERKPSRYDIADMEEWKEVEDLLLNKPVKKGDNLRIEIRYAISFDPDDTTIPQPSLPPPEKDKPVLKRIYLGGTNTTNTAQSQAPISKKPRTVSDRQNLDLVERLEDNPERAEIYTIMSVHRCSERSCYYYEKRVCWDAVNIDGEVIHMPVDVDCAKEWAIDISKGITTVNKPSRRVMKMIRERYQQQSQPKKKKPEFPKVEATLLPSNPIIFNMGSHPSHGIPYIPLNFQYMYQPPAFADPTLPIRLINQPENIPQTRPSTRGFIHPSSPLQQTVSNEDWIKSFEEYTYMNIPEFRKDEKL
ncbi:hypothetical protein F5884DRAFT_137303 [Xylogone sp. PMI_703]|nr:hypothetical protein F5884DRAFT_137303 [Xylogone sp. PMI_703]